MELVLGPLEARVIGALIEKEICTPDQYPLSLNALVNACNQKSNREPVLDLSELDIRAVVDELIRKRLVVNTAGFNARVPRYQHRFCNTEFGTLKFSEQELGIVCELLLRGPQTPGELRSRTNRLCSFDDVTQVDAALAALIEQGPYVVKLPREPGKRESRYAHLFSGGSAGAGRGIPCQQLCLPGGGQVERAGRRSRNPQVTVAGSGSPSGATGGLTFRHVSP